MKDYVKNLNEPSRRDFAAYLAKAYLGVGLLPGFIAGQAFAQSTGTAQGKAAEHVIYLYMSGGMTHLDTFDPKPGAETQGPVEAIKTNASGIRVSEYLPNVAKVADKVAFINSMSTTTGAHEQGRYFMRTAYPMRGTIKHPAIGSWMLKMKGGLNQTLPGYVLVGGGSSEATSGYMETKFAPVPMGNPAGGLPYGKRNVERDEFYERLTLANEFDKPFRRKFNQKQVGAYTNLYADAIKLMDSQDIKAFDISEEPKAIRDQYGDNSFGQGCLLARRLVENNVRTIEVHLGGWDMHSDVFNSVEDRVPILDQGLGALLADLDRRGLLSKTLVVLATEFGRTPNINVNRGRDHHPAAFSCLLAGGPVKGGQVYGKTDSLGVSVTENPVSIPDFNATIGKALGLNLDEVIKSRSGRPFTFADKGRPIDALV